MERVNCHVFLIVMHYLQRFQLPIFLICLLIPGYIFLQHISHLLPLFAGAKERQAVQNASDREGWLLSDIDVQAVSQQQVRLLLHEHHRGPDGETCFLMRLNDSSLHPCTPQP